MRRGLVLIYVTLLLIVNISALCGENQIDINSASAEELDELSGIGPVKANAIIDSRSFEKIDDLINVYGIGEATLEKIKEQGLACVGEEKKISNIEKESKDEREEIIDENSEENEIIDKITFKEDSLTKEEIEREVITLGTKTIKTETNNETVSEKGKSGLYLILFCFLLGLLFAIKGKLKRKNEFR